MCCEYETPTFNAFCKKTATFSQIARFENLQERPKGRLLRTFIALEKSKIIVRTCSVNLKWPSSAVCEKTEPRFLKYPDMKKYRRDVFAKVSRFIRIKNNPENTSCEFESPTFSLLSFLKNTDLKILKKEKERCYLRTFIS